MANVAMEAVVGHERQAGAGKEQAIGKREDIGKISLILYYRGLQTQLSQVNK